MNFIQKPLEKNEKELPKQTSKKVENKKIPQTEKKSKIRKQNYTTQTKRKISV